MRSEKMLSGKGFNKCRKLALQAYFFFNLNVINSNRNLALQAYFLLNLIALTEATIVRYVTARQENNEGEIIKIMKNVHFFKALCLMKLELIYLI